MSRYRSLMTLSAVLALPGCGTTRHFVEQPPLMVAGDGQTARQAAAQLLGGATPYQLRFCEAEPSSHDCRQGSGGIHANGVGGFIVPLLLHVSGMTVTTTGTSPDGWVIDASVQSTADAIAPLCRTAHGQIVLRDNGTLALQLRHFYCNWVLVGNVIVNADFSVDHLDLQHGTFSGYYKITFHGTGNAAGSGYYRAAVLHAAREASAATP
jgi:hypothetical protein